MAIPFHWVGKRLPVFYPHGIQIIYFACFLVLFNYSSLLFTMYFNINGSSALSVSLLCMPYSQIFEQCIKLLFNKSSFGK